MMDGPRGIRFDSSGNFYVADYNNGRINKFNSSGVFQGWIGNIATSPTGGAAGCNGAAAGTATPGWCKGGTSTSGAGDGMLYRPYDVVFDSSGNLYVADFNNHRISKYNSSGVFQGWIGKIATSPTGGEAGCNGAAVGSATPGWCTGGTSASGAGDGMMNGPNGLWLDQSGNLYLTERNNNRVSRYSLQGR
jgi:sugar lactone lactonase YvrE